MSNKLKAIKFECYQNMPNYRRPASFDFKETFKLPPYSSVIGMIHKICNCQNGEYMPMKLSIQGISESINTDLYTRYFFTPDKCESDRDYFAILNKNENKQTGLIRGTGVSELLIDVNLLIHIVPENDDLFDTILNGLKRPYVYPALGRHEDILCIHTNTIKFIDIEETNITNIKYDAYIPLEYFREEDNTTGTVYLLNKVFDTSSGTRKWKEKVKVKYIKKRANKIRFAKNVYKDPEENTGVFLA
ncbi:CRISPR-associated protein Cas5 [Brachyspira alvinipulli]|uniref:CRISPR-associated protein Cas5 n=1 Tax=Brachyspira alvinipulli TaxID=84379 RepID=UPI00047F9935|nr:CRISPR-associated protein Cas5 [Brachyspira alvinipulli]